jgi:hypothetical protein
MSCMYVRYRYRFWIIGLVLQAYLGIIIGYRHEVCIIMYRYTIRGYINYINTVSLQK